MFNALENSEKSDIFTQGRKWVKILYIYIKRVVSAAGTPYSCCGSGVALPLDTGDWSSSSANRANL